MDLTFQVPMQYCSLQHWTLLPLPVTFTTGCCFCFGSASAFFLDLFLYSSPVAFWAPTNLGVHLSVSYFLAFSYCSWGSQGKNTEWFAIPFSSGPCLSELSTMTCPSRVALHDLAHSFTELDKTVFHVICLVSFL